MEREIKFRAWDKKLNEWERNPDLTYIRLNGDIRYIEKENDGKYYEGKNAEKDLIIMQFTGLKDKNGTPIYEGDIMKTLSDVGNCIVEWQGNHFGIGFSCVDKEGAIVDFEDDWTDLEVIGNIYETPNLIK